MPNPLESGASRGTSKARMTLPEEALDKAVKTEYPPLTKCNQAPRFSGRNRRAKRNGNSQKSSAIETNERSLTFSEITVKMHMVIELPTVEGIVSKLDWMVENPRLRRERVR